MPEQREDSPREYDHKVMGEAWAEAFNTQCKQPYPVLRHPVKRNDAPENLPWDLLIGAHGSLPTWDVSNTAVEWWWRMQNTSLLGNTTSRTPSRREIGPSVAALAPPKLLEALVQVIPSAVLSLDTAAVRSPSQVSWHWSFPLAKDTSSPFYLSQLPVTRTVHCGGSVVFPCIRGIFRLAFHPKGAQWTFWTALPPPQQFLHCN